MIKKNRKKSNLADVFHHDLYGSRRGKYQNLKEKKISYFDWRKLQFREPNYFFIPRDYDKIKIYKMGFAVSDLFHEYVSGFQTKRDKITIHTNIDDLREIKEVFVTNKAEEIKNKLKLPKDGRDWKIKWAKEDLTLNNPVEIQVMYRPFDYRFTYFTGKSKGFIGYPRTEMFNYLNKENNVSLITCRQQSSFDFQHSFISRLISDMCSISSQTKETGYAFPLYINPDSNGQTNLVSGEQPKRKPNFNPKILDEIVEKLGLYFVAEESDKTDEQKQFAPIDLLDYIYAVLHSPTYRKTYKEFLKIDFPRVPYPDNQDKFWQLVELGGKLRKIHLLEDPIVEDYITTYPKPGNNEITRRLTKTKPGFIPEKENPEIGKVWINDEQYFDKVPKAAWEFYIGGYQPAQKWLKDRRDRTLEFEDILHYQKIIVALTETERLMREIDGVANV